MNGLFAHAAANARRLVPILSIEFVYRIRLASSIAPKNLAPSFPYDDRTCTAAEEIARFRVRFR